ncbi:hypothetical protein Mapa_001565 [Marchantia paleacea]|nr:hypothetical protein Mapa_001565 [Marchantia paleacea]
MGTSVLPFIVVLTVITVCLTVHAAAFRELKEEASPNAPDFPSAKEVQNLFEEWTKKYSKTYANERDKNAHFRNFKENLRRASEHNRKSSSYKLAMNQFADLTPEEFEKKHLMHRSPRKASTRHPNTFTYADLDAEEVPEAKNWVAKGAPTLSAVKTRGACDNPGDSSCKH